MAKRVTVRSRSARTCAALLLCIAPALNGCTWTTHQKWGAVLLGTITGLIVVAPPEPGETGEEEAWGNCLLLTGVGIVLVCQKPIMDGGAPPEPDADDDDTSEKEAFFIGDRMEWKLTAEF